jgi:peptidoglycan/xylan/chitin deacetylase (PgdA/CDA1 family)
MAWPGIDRWLGGPHRSELLCMRRAQLAELSERGWEIGAHTHSHPHLTRVDAETLVAELERPRALLEQWLGSPCRSLAYPYGDWSPAVAAAARAAGYRSAATLDATLAPRDPLLWPRVGVYQGDSSWRFKLKASPLARRGGLARLRHPLWARRSRAATSG